MRGYSPNHVILDEVANLPVDRGNLTEANYQAEMDDIIAFDKLLGAFAKARIETGKAAVSLLGFNKEAKKKPHFSKNQTTLHQKAVDRRKKRKIGGHK